MYIQRLSRLLRRRPRMSCKLLFYTTMWGMRDDGSDIPLRRGFQLLPGRDRLAEADVVIFHMPTLSREEAVILRRENKRSGQKWVFWSMECEAHYPWQYRPGMLELFDVHATYKMDSDIPTPYIGPGLGKSMRRMPAAKTGLVNAFMSSDYDLSGRVKLLAELMSYVDVHSYGKARRNKTLDNDKGEVTKLQTIASYKFSLAFENAIAKDYVTEKFFQPLIMGSVPVYLGAPNIAEFAPGEHCYIDVHAFSSIRSLADYLLMLDKDDSAYQSYLRWKSQPLLPAFDQKLAVVARSPLMRLYDLLEQRFSL